MAAVVTHGDETTEGAPASRHPSGHDGSPIVPMDAGDDALDCFRGVLANLSATITASLDGAARDEDPELLHELRVAVRRTRSVLAQGKGVLPREVRRDVRSRFGWLGRVTGPQRDLDVLLLGWDDLATKLDDVDSTSLGVLRGELERRRQVAHRELTAALQSTATSELLAEWDEWLRTPAAAGARARPIGPLIADRIAKAQRKVLRDGRSIGPKSPPARLHDLRKDAKRLRYLLECFGGLFDPAARTSFVSQLKDLQDSLGRHQDAEVHLHLTRDLAHDLDRVGSPDRDALRATERLEHHFERRQRRERRSFAKRFAAYDTKQNRRMLADLLSPVAKA